MYNTFYRVLTAIYDTGCQSKGVYAVHSIESLRLTAEERRELRGLQSKGYIFLFDGYVQFTMKGLEEYCNMDDEDFIGAK